MIPTWRERLLPDWQGDVSYQVKVRAMQAEIDDYKAALATIENATIERCANACKQWGFPVLALQIRVMKKEG